MQRPTPKELNLRIRAARKSLENGRIALLNQTVMACDAIDLEYDIEHDLMSLLPVFINELAAGDYVGQNPPQRSYAPEISGLELFAFKISKSPFQHPVYIKFAHADEILWLVSLHKDRTSTDVS